MHDVELLPWQISISLVEPDAIAAPIRKKTGQRDWITTTPEMQRLYGPAKKDVDDIRSLVGRWLSADKAAEAVVHALTARKKEERGCEKPLEQVSRYALVLEVFPVHRIRASHGKSA